MCPSNKNLQDNKTFKIPNKIEVCSTSFNHNEKIDSTLIHRRLIHVSYLTIEAMCRKIIMKGLPNKFLKPDNNDCIICWITRYKDPNKGLMISTENYKP